MKWTASEKDKSWTNNPKCMKKTLERLSIEPVSFSFRPGFNSGFAVILSFSGKRTLRASQRIVDRRCSLIHSRVMTISSFSAICWLTRSGKFPTKTLVAGILSPQGIFPRSLIKIGTRGISLRFRKVPPEITLRFWIRSRNEVFHLGVR